MTLFERRRNMRVSFETSADVRFQGKAFDNCATSNLSLKGVFVAGVTGQAAGDHCEITLHLNGTSSSLALNMKGRVVRVEENGLALHFSAVDLDSFYHLKNIIYYNSGNPEKLNEEFLHEIQAYQSID